MAELRTVVFIDGQNFKHNLNAFQFRGLGDPDPNRLYKLDEKHFHWRPFFKGIINKFDMVTGFAHRLVRVYWYNAATIRPFEGSQDDAKKIARDYQARCPGITAEIILDLAHRWHTEQRRHFDQTKEVVFEAIQRKTDFLEFKYVGEFVVKPLKPYRVERKEDGAFFYQGTQEGEKGVDVGIAVDMVSKMKDFDAAVLVSGDADFMPLVRYVKDSLRYVYQFSLAKGIPPRINYLSPWLTGCVDAFQAYNELELLENHLDRSAAIPGRVLQTIDQRIAQLRANAG